MDYRATIDVVDLETGFQSLQVPHSPLVTGRKRCPLPALGGGF